MAKQKVRPVRIEGDVAYVPLTQGLETVIDAADAGFIGQWNWCACKHGKEGTFYAARGERLGKNRKRTLLLHRAVIGYDGPLEIDHIDQNPLNNRRANLRLCTHAENLRNRKAHRDNKLGIKGVHWSPKTNSFEARVVLARKLVHYSRHTTAEEASQAYQQAAKLHHGEFYSG